MNTIEPVRKSIFVKASPERAFAVFTACTWWPKEHSILPEGSVRKEVIIEPRAGGQWYEVSIDGKRCDWGKVLAWEPPKRMLLGWQLNGNFEHDTSAMTELELKFTPEKNGTLVELEHRGFENYSTGQMLRDAVGSDNGWAGLLKLMAETAVK